ncbi:MAG: T9SS type A sorting domain-containing protein [Bacteroidales bacterium]|nr:T9SS type A sorting domain-containing protein [Bacteroidales bacterium]
MKKTQLFRKWQSLALLFVALCTSNIRAQECNIVITGSFESKCILPNEGPLFIDEFPQVIVACANSQVTYHAHAEDGCPVDDWQWTVTGAASVATNGDEATVTWGSAGNGEIVVRVSSSGQEYYHSQQVRIIETPSVAASSVPHYNQDHTIYVCKYGDVEFTDSSLCKNSNIAGYYWDGCGATSTSRSFSLTGITSPCTVTHRVYNNCGCYDEETFYIEVLSGDPLSISCYGTACAGSTVTYHAVSPNCNRYSWSIEGGTLVDGQDSQDITVTWDNPQSGYGTINLDGTLCDGNACRSSLSVKIPIITQGAVITGRTDLCVGDAALYSLPHFGSTYYEWDITPPNDVVQIKMNGANLRTYIFNKAGTYQIKVRYKCSFLTCGEFQSDLLTVTVKPRLEIYGEKEICMGNSAIYTANAIDADSLFTWSVYDMAGERTIYTSNVPEARLNTANITLWPGMFVITASHPNYCNVAELVLEVKDAPPDPTVDDLDPNNPAIACPNSGIVMKGYPSNPDYSLVWTTQCAPYPTATGNEVTINYGNIVCDVEVYNYDRRLRCMSLAPYVHNVSCFRLLPTSLPTGTVTVCPGTRIKWTDANVPYQDGVIYEWRLQEGMEFCATVEGSIFSNTISLLVNDFEANTAPPALPFSIYLHRTYCSGLKDTDTVTFQFADLRNTQLSIDPVGPLCKGGQAVLQGYGCTGSYSWTVDDGTSPVSGNPVNHQFNRTGQIQVTMRCNPYDYCTNRMYFPVETTSVQVVPNPPLLAIGYDGTNVYTIPTLSTTEYLFQWSHTATSSNIVPAASGVYSYTCTVTSRQPPYCSTTLSETVTSCSPLTVIQVGAFDYCNKTITLAVSNPPSQITWSIRGGGYGTPIYSGNNNEQITIPIADVGYYVVTASAGGTPCYSGSLAFVVDFLPSFSLKKECTMINIRNDSKYLDGSVLIDFSINNTTYGPFPVGQKTVSYNTNGGTYTVALARYGTTNVNCNIGTVSTVNTAGLNVSVTTANTLNQNKTCDNTALRLTAGLPSPHTVKRTFWVFDDNGTCLDTTMAPVHHTFEYRQFQYNVTVNVTDENGCVSSGGISITSHLNKLLEPEIELLDVPPVCEGDNVRIAYSASGNTPTGQVEYRWAIPNFPITVNNNYYNSTNHTGNCHVVATDDLYCKGEADLNVYFKNKPFALIRSEKIQYCAGETVVLHGEPDGIGQYNYQWTVTDGNTGMPYSYNTGTVKFPAGNAPCTYNVDLMITNAEGCTATDNITVTVIGMPARPTIAVDPNQQCIHQGPVRLESFGPVSEIIWSNGDYGPDAYYGYAGDAVAYYYDQYTGCRSDTAALYIPNAPDFDALLTGCYKICPDSAYGKLPVYGLLPLKQWFGFEWFYGSMSIRREPYSTWLGANSLVLPLNGFGDYHLDVEYNAGCTTSSKSLELVSGDDCLCDSIDISCDTTYTLDNNCHLVYTVVVTVCNHSSREACFKTLEPMFPDSQTDNITVTSTTFVPGSIAPHDCYTFSITLDVSTLVPNVATFRLSSEDCGCTAYFSIDLMPQVDCMHMCTGQISYTDVVSENDVYYYDFGATLPSVVNNVLAAWSEPQDLIDFGFNSVTQQVNGLCSFSAYDVENTTDVCIYLLVCTDTGLCVWYFCVPAEDLIEWLHVEPSKSKAKGMPLQAAEPRLMPNPTTGDVSVVGTDEEVVEVLVMDMNGRRIAAYDNTPNFNVSRLASGAYIVRVKTLHDATASVKTTYLKLVKK